MKELTIIETGRPLCKSLEFKRGREKELALYFMYHGVENFRH